MAHIAYFVNIVIAPSIRPVGQRVENGIARLRQPPHQPHNLAHRHATPLGHTRPALDAEMGRDLFLFLHALKLGQRELARCLDEPADPQAVIC
jgi:hypothetical protein